jgi:hypothetical protein
MCAKVLVLAGNPVSGFVEWGVKCVRVFICTFMFTVAHPGMETELMETIWRFASVSLKKIETDLLGSWWPGRQCVLPFETRLEPRPRLKPDEWKL